MEKNVKKSNRQKRKPTSSEASTIPAKVPKVNMMSKRIPDLFNNPSYNLAQNILGKILVRKIDDVICKGRIVETECYPGGDDKASCTFNGKRTPASEPLYMEPGTLFVYMTYGMYYCMNISSSEPGGGVLIRALEPLEGIDHMKNYRIGINLFEDFMDLCELKGLEYIFQNVIYGDKLKKKREIKTEHLCNGPSKLCTSLQITKTDFNMLNLETSDSIWIENDPNYEIGEIIHTGRVGIAAAGQEWAEKPYRFYISKSECISKRDILKEKKIEVEGSL